MDTKITDPHSLQNNSLFSIDNYRIMNRERWEGIVECKKKFLADNSYDPRECPYMDPDIAASWIMCRKMDANPYQSLLGRRLEKEAFLKVLDRNHTLIKITTPIINTFKNLAISNSYGIYLADNRGIFLLHEGKVLTLPVDASLIGMIWDESLIGTSAHSMSINYKRPFILFGAENYCIELENIVASAACIKDENGNVIATIVLAQALKNEPWDELFQKYCTNTLALITAISTAVESQLRLQKSFASLKMANKTLEATLASIDEGIITIDQNGMIVYSNEEGRKIFKLSEDEAYHSNIRDFLEKDSKLMAMAAKGESGNIEETIHSDQIDENYIINVQSVLDDNTEEFDGALLRINSAGKINAMTANRAGAVARFTFENIIGESDAIKKAITKGQYYSEAPENILLIGESGTGKELFAQSIHNKYCSGGPFIAVNCAALPRELIESELFGYEGGSFTGADRSGRPGKIELAEGGTLFLDEIGDMPFELQAVLLRVLEDKQVMRIGARRSKKVEFKVIAATNQNLSSMVKEKRFRADLYYRLSVLTIAIPPLRDRNKDIDLLANYFVRRYSRKIGKKIPKISQSVLDVINNYTWPGNVRELENAMVHAVINSGEIIDIQDLPEKFIFMDTFKTSDDIVNYDNIEEMDKIQSLADTEKSAILKGMKMAKGNVVLAACLLGISKSTIYRKLKEYDINY